MRRALSLAAAVLLFAVFCEFSPASAKPASPAEGAALCKGAVGIYYPLDPSVGEDEVGTPLHPVLFSNGAIRDYSDAGAHLSKMKMFDIPYTPASASKLVGALKKADQFTLLLELDEVPTRQGTLLSIAGGQSFPSEGNLEVRQVDEKGKLGVAMRTSGNAEGMVSVGSALRTGKRNTLGLVYDGKTLVLHVNGGSQQSELSKGNLRTWSMAYSMVVGAALNMEQRWGGKVRGVAFWARALMPDEVRLVFSDFEQLKSCSPLVGPEAPQNIGKGGSIDEHQFPQLKGADRAPGLMEEFEKTKNNVQSQFGDPSGNVAKNLNIFVPRGGGHHEDEDDDSSFCVLDSNCLDGNPCTEDVCEGLSCVHNLVDESCDHNKYYVRVILECVDELSDGQYLAHWGYLNEFWTDLEIGAGTHSNKFSPPPKDRGQPSVFAPGRHVDVFQTQFSGSQLVWTLKSPDGSTRTATASSSSERCSPPPPPPPGGEDDDDPQCSVDEDCVAENQCQTAACNQGSCELGINPSCTKTGPSCAHSSGCDDGDRCTSDLCVLGECYSLPIQNCDPPPPPPPSPGPCSTSQDCVSQDPCFIGNCIVDTCQYTARRDCSRTPDPCSGDLDCSFLNAQCRRGGCDTANSLCYQYEVAECVFDSPQCPGGELYLFDFEELATGTIVGAEYLPIMQVFSQNQTLFPAMVFNSSNPTGGDPDLGTPNQAFGGPGVGAGGTVSNNRPLGQILIVSEDGDQSDPDDRASGGDLVFTFTCPARPLSSVYIDLGDTVDGWVFANSSLGSIASAEIPETGVNGVETVEYNITADGHILFVVLTQSGALDELRVCTAPCGCDGVGGHFDECGVCGGDGSTCPPADCCDKVNVTQEANVHCSITDNGEGGFEFFAAMLFGGDFGIPTNNTVAVVDFGPYVPGGDIRERGTCANRNSDTVGPWPALWDLGWPSNGWVPSIGGTGDSTWANYTRSFTLQDLEGCEDFDGNTLINFAQQPNGLKVEGNMWMSVVLPAKLSDESKGELVPYSFPCQFDLEFGNGGTVSTQFDTEKIGFHILNVQTLCTKPDEIFVVQFVTEINTVEEPTSLVSGSIASQTGAPQMELVSGTPCQPSSPPGKCRQIWTLQSVAPLAVGVVDLEVQLLWNIEAAGTIRSLDVQGKLEIKSDNPCANFIDIDSSLQSNITLYTNDSFLQEYHFGQNVFIDCEEVCGIVDLVVPENSCEDFDLEIHRITICASDLAPIPPFDPLDPQNTGCNAPVPGKAAFVVFDRPTNWFGGQFWKTRLPLPTPDDCPGEEGFCFEAHRITPNNSPITVQATWVANPAAKKRGLPQRENWKTESTSSFQLPLQSRQELQLLLKEVPTDSVLENELRSSSHGRRSLSYVPDHPDSQFEVRCPPSQEWYQHEMGYYGCKVPTYHHTTYYHHPWLWWWVWCFFVIALLFCLLPWCFYKFCYCCHKGRSYHCYKQQCVRRYPQRHCPPPKKPCHRECPTKNPYAHHRQFMHSSASQTPSPVILPLPQGYSKKNQRRRSTREPPGRAHGTLVLDISEA